MRVRVLRSALKRFLTKNCPNCHVCLRFDESTIKIYLRILRSLFPFRLRKHPHFYLILLLFLSSFAKISPFQNFAIVSYFSETNRTTWDSPDTDLGGRYPRCIPSHLCCHTVFYIAVPYANLITQHITEIHESPERVFDFLKETETDRKSICICMHRCVCVSVVVRKREGERRGKDGFLLRGWKFGKTFHNRRDILDQPARQRWKTDERPFINRR